MGFERRRVADPVECGHAGRSVRAADDGWERPGYQLAGRGAQRPGWVSTVHQHGRLALITVGGISDQHWSTACNSTYRGAFVSNLVSYMVSNGFDGVDIDIEQNDWGSQQPPVAAWDTCVQAISQAAHAARTQAGATPIVSTDIDQTWMDSDVAGFATYPDQFNLMGYSNSCNNSCMAAQVRDLLDDGQGALGHARLTMGDGHRCGRYRSHRDSGAVREHRPVRLDGRAGRRDALDHPGRRIKPSLPEPDGSLRRTGRMTPPGV